MTNYLEKFNNYDDMVVLLVGSSITSAEWCHPNWQDWLTYTFKQDDNWELGYRRKLINVAKDGATIDHFLMNFDSEIVRFKPDLVILSLGLNSIISQFDPFRVERELRLLYSKILSMGSELATWSYNINSEKYRKQLVRLRDVERKIADDMKIPFVDIYAEFEKYDMNKLFTFIHPWENKPWGMKPGDTDYIHCNEAGNQIIAQKIAKVIFNKELNNEEFGTMKLLDLTEYLK